MSEQAFEIAHRHVAKWEGGLSDHPSDPGGVTNYGICLRFLTELASEQWGKNFLDCRGISTPVSRDTILKLTKDDARAIMRYVFWERSAIATLPDPVAVVAYDMAVNGGTGRSAILLQRAINDVMGKQVIARTAGNFGPLTRRYAEQLAKEGKSVKLANAFNDRRLRYYRDLAAEKPTMQVFLRGWENRVNACKAVIDTEF